MRSLVLYLFLLTPIYSCSPRYTSTPSSAIFYDPGIPDTIRPDTSLTAVIAPWKHQMDSVMSQVICTSAQAMDKGIPESPLGNMVADACLWVFRKQHEHNNFENPIFCVLNNGGLRSALPAGVVLRRHIYELMPFENELAVVRLPGKAVKAIFSYIVSRGGVPVSNLKMSLSDSLFRSVNIGDHLFVDTLEYEVLTSDYLAGGGDQMEMFRDSIRYESTNIKVRDAIIMYLSENGCSTKSPDGRITQ